MEQAQVTLIAKLKSDNEKLRLENDDLRLKETTFDLRPSAPHPHHHDPATSDPDKLYHQSPLDVSDGAKHSPPHQQQQWPPHRHHHHLQGGADTAAAADGSKFGGKDGNNGAPYRCSSSPPPLNFQSFIVNSMHGGGGGGRSGDKLDAAKAYDGVRLAYDEDRPLRAAAAARRGPSSSYDDDRPPGGETKPPQRLLGEVAFQLEQRVLAHVFQGQQTFYGFTVLNVREKIVQVATRPFTGMLDEGYQRHLLARHAELMDKLGAKCGYSAASHPMFAQFIINSYGRLGGREAGELDRGGDAVRKALVGAAPSYVLKDMLVLLGCLTYMAGKDGKALFLW